jgi:hypothetical protein
MQVSCCSIDDWTLCVRQSRLSSKQIDMIDFDDGEAVPAVVNAGYLLWIAP